LFQGEGGAIRQMNWRKEDARMLQRRKKGSLFLAIMLLLSLLAPMLTLPVPALAASGTVLFNDDFQDGDMSDWMQNGGTWSVINEAGSETNKVLRQSHTSNEAILTNGDLGWSDYSYEVKIGFVDAGAYPGILVRAQDHRNYYMLRINPANKRLEFAKRVGGTDSATLASAPINELAVNTSYVLKVEAVGSHFRSYVNGNLAFEYYDADQSFLTGKIGFRDRWGAFQADDIKVTQIVSQRTPYNDDFESGSISGWTAMTGDGVTVVDIPSAGWSVVDSVYGGTKQLQRSAPEGGMLVGGVQSLFNDKITAQYAAQDPNAVFGIIGRLTQAGDHYMLKANTPASQLELIKRISGTSTVIGSVYYPFALNTPYTLSFDILDNELTGYVNGEQQLQAVDGALDMGKSGLWTEGGAVRIEEVNSSVLTGSKIDSISVSLNDSAVGRMYEGISYVSSSGSTKLLMDYPPEQQQDIIDLLFKPNFGASLDHYKMEIGSDANSSSGTEPSHMRSATDLDITRGSGLWLAKKAKEVNPELTLEALRWGTPKWITNNDEKYLFYKNYLQGARDVFGLEIDYLGPDQNEGAFDRNYVVNTLRPGLDRDGFENVKLIARDAVSNPWDIATQMKSDSALRDAIDVIGGHYVFTSTADAQASGKPLWHSEARPPMRSLGLRGSAGALSDVVKGIMTSYVNGKMTRFEMQPFLESWYDIVPYNTKGALVADKPWSGYYFVDKGVWLTAHFTQFAKPGWYYLDSSSAVGDKFNYVTYKKPDNSGDYSVVVVNTTDKPQKYMFTVSGGLSKGIVHPWKTTETEDFVQLPAIVPEDGAYSITLEPFSVYSLTTTTGQQKGQPKHGVPADTHLQLPYADSFDSYATHKQPLYAHDQGGAFEVTEAGLSGKGLRQVITADIKPGDWRGTPDPYTLFGDLEWANYNVSTDVSLEGNTGGYAYIAGRVVDSPYSNAPAVGYNLKLNGSGAWELRLGASVLQSGSVNGLDAAQWHKLKLTFVNEKLSAYIDGSKIADYTIPIGGLSSGQIALGSGYHFATFDNLRIEAADSAVPAYVERIDNAEPGIVYAGGLGRWSHVVDSYSHFKRTLSKASAGSLVSVNDRTTGSELYQFNYTGSWSSGSQSGAMNGDNSWSSVAGNAFSVKFVGTQAHMYSAVAAGHGIFAVSIDGGAETLVDLYSPTRTDQKLVYSSPVLPSGEHTITVRVTGTRNSSATGAAVVADRMDIDTGESKDAELEYAFTGTGFNLIGIADGGRIKADIYVDGVLKESVDQAAEQNGYKRVLYRLAGLGNGTHTLKVVLKSNVQLDALEILGASAAADIQTSLSGPAKVNAGEEFELSYAISGITEDVFAQQAAFTYDPSKIEFISAESLKYEFATVDTSIAGKARFLAASTGQAVAANGDILKLRWRAKQAMASTTATIAVTNVELGLAEGKELSASGTAHRVEIVYVDKSSLNARISQAQGVHDSAQEGSAVGQYPAGSKAKLLAAIEAARAVAADVAAGSEQVEQALAVLTAELSSFEASVITRMHGDLNGDGKFSIGDLGMAAQYYGKTSSDPNWDVHRVADLNQDGKVDILDISAVAQKIIEG
jgi:galactosylceramidase